MADRSEPQLTDEEAAELVERINGNPNLHPEASPPEGTEELVERVALAIQPVLHKPLTVIARAALQSLGYAEMGWQPIETAENQAAAPWDGVPVLIYTNHNWGGETNRIHRAHWTDDVHGSGIFGWAIDDLKHGPYPLRGYTLVTHWMPLPEPPRAASPGKDNHA